MQREEPDKFEGATAGLARRSLDLSSIDVARLRSRDSRALTELFEASFDRIYSLIYRLCGDHAQTEDLTQEVFARIHRSIDRLDVERDPWPWIVTIAYNVFRDLVRSGGYRGARRSVSIDERPEVTRSLHDDNGDPEQQLLHRERERLVENAIRELPPEQRETVVLHAFAGMSHGEVARATGTSAAATRKAYSRAIAAIGRSVMRTYA